MSEKRSPFASAIANYEARKAAREAEAILLQENASPERANVVPLKAVEQKIQERRNHAPKPLESQQAKPLRVKPRQTNKAEGTDKAFKAETVLPPSQQLSSMKIPKRQAPFEKRYRRVTTYLENGVYVNIDLIFPKTIG